MRTFLTFLAFNLFLSASAQNKEFIRLKMIDQKIKPGDNFYQYANGEGLRTLEIPNDQNVWGGFQTLEIENMNKLRSLFEIAYQENYPPNSNGQKVADFYFSTMDTITINKVGSNPLQNTLIKIERIRNHNDLLHVIAEGYKVGEISILGFSVASDAKNSNRNIASFNQAGLSLEKADYDSKDSSTIKERNSLLNYASTLFSLTGDDRNTALQKAAYVLDLETKMAKSHLTNVEARNPELSYHKMAVNDVTALMSGISWRSLLRNMDIHTDSINVGHLKYFEALDSLLINEPIEAWKAKLSFDYINNKAWLLSEGFVQAKFDFFKVRWGWQSKWERWKDMAWFTNNYLGDLVRQLYLKEYFDEKAKRKVEDMAENIQSAFSDRIKNLDWMSTATKQEALNKLAGVIKKIGYPDNWKNYDDVVIVRDDLMSNLESIERHNYRNMINKIDKPVNRFEWVSSVTSVGGYYNAYSNEFGLPAGGLQLPFFDLEADDAVNYGATGTIIGHELIHGFDDQGRKFDGQGNLKDWWTTEDKEKYNQMAKALIYQVNQYKLFDTIPLNGELTLGENIADLGGITLAYEAFKNTQQYKEQKKIEGFTPEQRFFLAYAQSKMIAVRPDLQRRLINIDPHSPVEFRINGTLSNFTPFYQAFKVFQSDVMFRPESIRLTIW